MIIRKKRMVIEAELTLAECGTVEIQAGLTKDE